jgi:TolB-like protein/tetratricopeptide (TPR) repeat protein
LLVDKFWLEATPEAITNNISADTPTPATPSGPESTTIQNGSIAVLPFANRSDDKDDVYFTDGIHDDLLTQLAKIQDLKVISRTSVMKYKDTQKTIPEIARELGVTTILEGGIQRAGKRIRINAQLIDVSNDQHLWAETFDREMTVENIFDIQSEIARQIVTAVRGELTDAETANLAQFPTHSLPAYEAYLHAMTSINNAEYSAKKYIAAEEWLNKAVEYDPEFALAWAQLVVTNAMAIWIGYDESPARFQAVETALARAETLGPGLPETIAAKAEYLYRIKSDFHAAKTVFELASQAKPGDADLLIRLATTERRTADFEASFTHLQMAIDLDPANLHARYTLVSTLVLVGQFQRAQPLADLWIDRYPETNAFLIQKANILLLRDGDAAAAQAIVDGLAWSFGVDYTDTVFRVLQYQRKYPAVIEHWARVINTPSEGHLSTMIALLATGQAYQALEDTSQADEFINRAIRQGEAYQSPNPNNMAWSLDALAQAYASAGKFELALKTSAKAQAAKPEIEDSIEGPLMSMTHAMMLGLAGQRDAALAEIERLLNTPVGFRRWDLYLNPNWDFFRDDEHFNDLVRPLNLEETGK